jgi:hypothetical protein
MCSLTEKEKNCMPKNTPVAPITDADIDALQGVLNDLKAGAKKAQEEKNLTTFRIYERLVKIVSPEVVKAHARKEREENARMSKAGAALKTGGTATP